MNLQVHIIIIMACVALNVSLQAQSNTNAALLKEFQLKTEKWKEAYNSGDAENLIPFYTEHARYVSGHVEGLELTGRENLIANFQRGISGGGHIDNIEIINIEKSRGLVTILTKYQANNNGQIVKGRNILVLKKVNKQWLIVMHASIV